MILTDLSGEDISTNVNLHVLYVPDSDKIEDNIWSGGRSSVLPKSVSSMCCNWVQLLVIYILHVLAWLVSRSISTRALQIS